MPSIEIICRVSVSRLRRVQEVSYLELRRQRWIGRKMSSLDSTILAVLCSSSSSSQASRQSWRKEMVKNGWRCVMHLSDGPRVDLCLRLCTTDTFLNSSSPPPPFSSSSFSLLHLQPSHRLILTCSDTAVWINRTKVFFTHTFLNSSSPPSSPFSSTYFCNCIFLIVLFLPPLAMKLLSSLHWLIKTLSHDTFLKSFSSPP